MGRDPFRGDEPLEPGSTIGIIGGGQLGRMIAIAARQMGYRIAVLDPDADGPTAQVADHAVVAAYDDRDAARELARVSDVLTYEFENADADAAEAAGEIQPLYPSGNVLRTAQHRIREKNALTRHGLPVAEFREVHDADDFSRAINEIGAPSVLKTATSGYDGKGQVVIKDVADGPVAYQKLKDMSPALVLERFVKFQMELSVVCARDQAGRAKAFPAAENIHVNNVLDTSIVPARVSPAILEKAANLAIGVAEALDVVGLIAVEMFLTSDDELLINELAPRPHNSGHYTIEGCKTSQFEQLVRVICGLPMGSVEMAQPAAMVNLLGDVWVDTNGKPDWSAALGLDGVSLHLYGKSEARAGRKMGHITATAHSVDEAVKLVTKARQLARRAKS